MTMTPEQRREIARRGGLARAAQYVPHDEERFWNLVQKGDGCWQWLGSKTRGGYGMFGVSRPHWHNVIASRHAYTLTYGEIPSGFDVCHRCDNPSCVNPSHLFLGTAKENMQDAARKGRMRPPRLKGEEHPHAKLTTAQVVEINRRAAAGERQASLAREFGISAVTVCQIVKGNRWVHVKRSLDKS